MQNITIFVFNNIVGYPDFQLARPFVFINIVGYPFIFLCAGGGVVPWLVRMVGMANCSPSVETWQCCLTTASYSPRLP